MELKFGYAGPTYPLLEVVQDIARRYPRILVRHQTEEGDFEGAMTIEEYVERVKADLAGPLDRGMRNWLTGKNFWWGFWALGFVKVVAMDPEGGMWSMVHEVEGEYMPVGRPGMK